MQSWRSCAQSVSVVSFLLTLCVSSPHTPLTLPSHSHWHLHLHSRRTVVRYFQTYADGAAGESEGVSGNDERDTLSTGGDASGDHGADANEDNTTSSTAASTTTSAMAADSKEDETLLPREEGTLAVNLGVPIVLLVTKAGFFVSCFSFHDHTYTHTHKHQTLAYTTERHVHDAAEGP